MIERIFLKMSVIIIVSFMFIKVYQCNKFIKINYEKQRVEKSIHGLLKKIDALDINLMQLHNYQNLRDFATIKQEMQPLCLSKIIVLPKHDDI